ncbi:hypothetical protein EPA93_45295 [Ktedonosporobacter rubrisoli]|uniref:Guanylate cyclase domain-containing protein n=1 Tax=Ktedonosporobacter rubrisoli TaxID=2509675 RepID=A0A4P6K4N5_KTERU|nr:hypothetical protein [Ktedonosporobacter rubrisoli]QBD82800.1 hypothetical protein EPA93_45295 [Ktedonosporobacter rubrisoli]
MLTLPIGTLTFLFTDIEGSTVRWERYPEAMRRAVARHDSLLQEIMEAHSAHAMRNELNLCNWTRKPQNAM